VAKASYVDPRVVDLFHDGVAARVPPAEPGDDPRAEREAAEAAVLRLLADEAD
jgi:hypothetical protein